MPARRTYGDACGIARALDAVGERWALMVVRELVLGAKRFTDIRASLPHLSPDVLAERLRGLEQAGIVQRRTLRPPAACQVYELTARGRALEPVLVELGRWGGANAAPPEDGCPMSLDSHILSFRTLFDPGRAEDFRATVQLKLGDDRFLARVAGPEFEIDRGEAEAPDATIVADPTTLIDVAHGRRKLAEARRAGDLSIEGDRRAATRFLGLFPLPAAADAEPVGR